MNEFLVSRVFSKQALNRYVLYDLSYLCFSPCSNHDLYFMIPISFLMILNSCLFGFKEFFKSFYIISLWIRYGSHNTKYHGFPPYIVLWESYTCFVYLCLNNSLLVISILLRQVYVSYTRIYIFGFEIEFWSILYLWAILQNMSKILYTLFKL